MATRRLPAVVPGGLSKVSPERRSSKFKTHRAPTQWKGILEQGRRLAKAGDPEGVEILLTGLRWRYDTARNQAIREIAELGRDLVPRLMGLARLAPTAVERGAAIDILTFVGDRRALPVLRRSLRDKNMVVRRAATAALVRFNDRRAVPQISRLLSDPSGGVRVWAAEALGRLKDPRALPALLRATKDPKWYVRLEAIRALGGFADRRSIPRFRNALKDPRPGVRKAAQDALARAKT